MARAVRQYRYYGEDGNSYPRKNQPQGEINIETLSEGTVFFSEENLGSIIPLGIQTLPGTKFYINNAKKPIIVGATGIYELELNGVSEIKNLRFAKEDLQIIDNLANAYLIVDALHEVEEE